MRRLDCDGRDVTDLPGLWDDADRVIYTPDEAMAMLPAGDGYVAAFFTHTINNRTHLYHSFAVYSRDVIRIMFDEATEIEADGHLLTLMRKGYRWHFETKDGTFSMPPGLILVEENIKLWPETAAPPQLGCPGGAEVANAS